MDLSPLHMVLILSTLFADVYLAEGKTDVCNCDHCPKTIDYTKEADQEETPSAVVPLNREDTDGDGLLQICARSRDLPDRSFPSICHMLCHNRCTRYNVAQVLRGKINRPYHITTARRPNYYKLRDGPCQ